MQFNQPLNPTLLILPFPSIEDPLDLPWNRDGSGGGSERDRWGGSQGLIGLTNHGFTLENASRARYFKTWA